MNRMSRTELSASSGISRGGVFTRGGTLPTYQQATSRSPNLSASGKIKKLTEQNNLLKGHLKQALSKQVLFEQNRELYTRLTRSFGQANASREPQTLTAELPLGLGTSSKAETKITLWPQGKDPANYLSQVSLPPLVESLQKTCEILEVEDRTTESLANKAEEMKRELQALKNTPTPQANLLAQSTQLMTAQANEIEKQKQRAERAEKNLLTLSQQRPFYQLTGTAYLKVVQDYSQHQLKHPNKPFHTQMDLPQKKRVTVYPDDQSISDHFSQTPLSELTKAVNPQCKNTSLLEGIIWLQNRNMALEKELSELPQKDGIPPEERFSHVMRIMNEHDYYRPPILDTAMFQGTSSIYEEMPPTVLQESSFLGKRKQSLRKKLLARPKEKSSLELTEEPASNESKKHKTSGVFEVQLNGSNDPKYAPVSNKPTENESTYTVLVNAPNENATHHLRERPASLEKKTSPKKRRSPPKTGKSDKANGY